MKRGKLKIILMILLISAGLFLFLGKNGKEMEKTEEIGVIRREKEGEKVEEIEEGEDKEIKEKEKLENKEIKKRAEGNEIEEIEKDKKEAKEVEEIKEPKKIEIKSVEYDVPFTPQAPFGSWEDKRQQEGCEEASVLMAIYWARDMELTPESAKEKILDMADYQLENYGAFVDTDVDDTAGRLLKGYFNYSGYQVKKNVSQEDIIKALVANNLVIVPLDGRKVGNPFYTPPGPDRHNLVIIGYDHQNRQFITNDPGTKRGERFRYGIDVLYDSIRDYPTGDDNPIEGMEKNMIIVDG